MTPCSPTGVWVTCDQYTPRSCPVFLSLPLLLGAYAHPLSPPWFSPPAAPGFFLPIFPSFCRCPCRGGALDRLPVGELWFPMPPWLYGHPRAALQHHCPPASCHWHGSLHHPLVLCSATDWLALQRIQHPRHPQHMMH